MLSGSRSQGSVEAIIALGLLILFIVIAITPFVINIVSYRSVMEVIDADSVCNRLYATVSAALTSGKDFSQVLSLPEKIGNNDYTINVYPAAMHIIIEIPSNTIMCQLQSGAIINATNSSEPFILNSKSLRFTNLNTVVRIEEL
jgi:hypothetical protein